MLKIIPQSRKIKYISIETVKLNHLHLGQSRLSKRVTDNFIRFVNLPDGEENVTKKIIRDGSETQRTSEP